MPQPAARQNDTVTGTDIHIVLVPSPSGAVPTPTPHPFIGRLTSGLSSDVQINGLAAATQGSTAQANSPHVPIGGPSFARPPTNQGPGADRVSHRAGQQQTAGPSRRLGRHLQRPDGRTDLDDHHRLTECDRGMNRSCEPRAVTHNLPAGSGKMASELIGRGWAYPCTLTPGGAVQLRGGGPELDAAIAMIIATAPGERVMRPDFGCAIWENALRPDERPDTRTDGAGRARGGDALGAARRARVGGRCAGR